MTQKPESAPEAGTPDSAQVTPEEDQTRQKFREALARKQRKHHASADSAEHDGSDKSHGAPTPTQSKPFRRKAI
ncbi:MAG: DUF5302 domain-containing protein [Nocardioidaceae bacterium]